MAYSEAKKKATIKYQKKTYDRIELKVKKGEKEKIKARAEAKSRICLIWNESVSESITKSFFYTAFQ